MTLETHQKRYPNSLSGSFWHLSRVGKVETPSDFLVHGNQETIRGFRAPVIKILEEPRRTITRWCCMAWLKFESDLKTLMVSNETWGGKKLKTLRRSVFAFSRIAFIFSVHFFAIFAGITKRNVIADDKLFTEDYMEIPSLFIWLLLSPPYKYTAPYLLLYTY